MQVRLPDSQAPSVAPFPALPSLSEALPRTGAILESLTTPPLPESVRQRRQIAIESILQQRAAVREQLLATRLEILPQLEARWRAEIESEYDLAALYREWDEAWFQAFQAYGRERFLPLFETLYFAPDSPRYQQAKQRLAQLDQQFAQQEQALQGAFQERLQRIEQEIAVRLRAKRREFERQMEQEVDQILASQPDLRELYLPVLEPLSPSSAVKVQIPPLQLQVSGENLNSVFAERQARAQRMRAELLQRLAQEWAEGKGYRLSDLPTARDATAELERYLSAR